MSFGEDEEILQDFLVEAGEILDLLSEQLVDLEQRPDDHDLLNAIFRGFHTVKGGAGFLQLDAMVECCHVTENLFDILRNGKRIVTSELMDVVLQALDTVNMQFRQVSQKEDIQRASPELIAQLGRLVSCEDLTDASNTESIKKPSAAPPPATVPPDPQAAESAQLSLSDDEFEGLLDAINDESPAPVPVAPIPTPAAPAVDTSHSDEITEDEFDALLDQLHGAGKRPGVMEPSPASSAKSNVLGPRSAEPTSEEISEAEFESLLDQLHGVGQGPGGQDAAKVPSPPPAPEPKQTTGQSSPKKSSPPAAPSPKHEVTELITDDEFEDLLDQLHGRGKGPTVVNAAAAVVASSPPPAEEQASRTREAAPSAPKTREAAPAPAPAQGGNANNQAAAAEATVRVDTQRLDDIMNMVGELVLVRNRLVRLGLDSSDESLSKAVANLDVVTADLQTAVMKTRMQPIKKVFGRFPRVVRDLARNLKKEINLELVGEETDLDKNLVEALADPLVHLVRNSVDHGIELPAAREAAGKPRVGKVILAAEQEGDHILLSISDDGLGMDPEKLREKAIEKGIMDVDAAARLSDIEAFNLIFAPGFSTKTEISDVSGRGVGMDVVKTKITQLNGSIEILSKKGEGTRFIIKVPLTLAIMPTLMIMLGKQCFALPLVSVNEIFHMDLSKSHVVDGQECVTIRDKAIPIFHLKRWLINGFGGPQKLAEAHVVIVTVGTRRVGFVVDQLIGQEEVVIKPLGKMLQGTPGMAGATITGDGTIALILDVPSLLKRYAGGI